MTHIRPVHCACCGRLDVAAWLKLRGVTITPALALDLETVVTGRGMALRELGITPSTFGDRLTKKGLPNPHHWQGLARAISCMQAIRAAPDATVATISRSVGYRDHTGLVHTLARHLGVGIGEAREIESSVPALMDRWWSQLARPKKARRAA